jgi:hypothetical protein
MIQNSVVFEVYILYNGLLFSMVLFAGSVIEEFTEREKVDDIEIADARDFYKSYICI